MKYKNIAGKDLFLRGYGLVKKDSEVNSEIEIKNKNFIKVVEEKIIKANKTIKK